MRAVLHSAALCIDEYDHLYSWRPMAYLGIDHHATFDRGIVVGLRTWAPAVVPAESQLLDPLFEPYTSYFFRPFAAIC